MKDDATNLARPAEPPAGAVRKPYHQPKLVRFGRLTEITRSVGPVGADDATPGAKTQLE